MVCVKKHFLGLQLHEMQCKSHFLACLLQTITSYLFIYKFLKPLSIPFVTSSSYCVLAQYDVAVSMQINFCLTNKKVGYICDKFRIKHYT